MNMFSSKTKNGYINLLYIIFILMSSLTLDGSTRIVATEFVKLEITGTSNLATESYVNTAIINGGGGGGADLTNYYDKTETDTLLNNKYHKSETDTLLND